MGWACLPGGSVLCVLIPEFNDWGFTQWDTTLHRQRRLHIPLWSLALAMTNSSRYSRLTIDNIH
jgi:hypothetical protein